MPRRTLVGMQATRGSNPRSSKTVTHRDVE
nr:MAG TPA: hypothetical protein [Caudoviricetes sp.]